MTALSRALERLRRQEGGSADADRLSTAGVVSRRTLHSLLRNSQADPEVRISAFRVVESLRDRGAIPGAVAALLHDADANIINEAGRTLDTLGATEALPTLRRALKAEGSDWNRRMIAWVLGNLRDRRSVPLLVSILKSGNSSALRGEVAEALGNIGKRSLVVSDALIESLKDPSPEVRFWAAFSLGKLVEVRALGPLRRLSRQKATVPGYWSVGKEARDAIRTIERASA